MKCIYPILVDIEGFQEKQEVPCGKCPACLITKKQQLTARMILEAQEYEVIYFVTLTYSDYDIPMCCSVSKRDAQLFLKRLRRNSEVWTYRQDKRYKKVKKLVRDECKHRGEFRYVLAAEYGTDPRYTLRPHYHAIIYTNEDPKIKFAPNKKGETEIVNSIFHNAWYPDSRVDVVPILTKEDVGGVVAYVAGYVLKKLENLEEKYENENRKFSNSKRYVYKRKDGRRREFVLISKHPAIGCSNIEKVTNQLEYYHEKSQATDTKDRISKQRLQMLRINGKKWPIGRTLRNKIYEKMESRKIYRNASGMEKARGARIATEFRNSEDYQKFYTETKARAEKKIKRWQNAKRKAPTKPE